ncbi:SDR family NAD(P)-dependent oxidoreductase [Pseudonocardia xinjiangensis]|uniref:SDR family NAD(P)-dependent oxidoreductase n=1 Tax=Pseudonocardia xinjiangensis TaxID=75289 RepID=UPI003D8AE202
MGKLDNKVAIVTGGSRGIGAASALALADEGADVAISYSSSADQAKHVVADLEAKGVRTAAFQADQADPVQAAGLIHRVVDHFGKLDILVNNAGVTVAAPIDSEAADEAAFDRQLAINYTSVVAAIRAAFPLLPEGGRIISISSGVGSRVGFSGMTDYSGAKSALEGYSRGAARDLAHRGITVNVIQAGFVDTAMNPAEGPYAAMFPPHHRDGALWQAGGARCGRRLSGEPAGLVRHRRGAEDRRRIRRIARPSARPSTVLEATIRAPAKVMRDDGPVGNMSSGLALRMGVPGPADCAAFNSLSLLKDGGKYDEHRWDACDGLGTNWNLEHRAADGGSGADRRCCGRAR